MELDFGSIRFCGRYQELQQLNFLLDEVRGNNNGDQHHHGGGGPPGKHPRPPSSSMTGKSSNNGSSHCHQDSSSDEVASVNTTGTNTTSTSSPSPNTKPCHKFVTIEAPSGTGKSTLVEHFLDTVMEKQEHEQQRQQKRVVAAATTTTTTTGMLPQPPSSSPHHPHDGSGGENSSSSGSSDVLHPNQLLLVGRGKFEESNTLPFSTLAECMNVLLEELIRYDPEWTTTLPADIRRELKRLGNVFPTIRTLLQGGEGSTGTRGDEALSTVYTGSSSSSDSSDSQSGYRQWSFERTRMAFQTLIRTICAEYTVILSLDDLQWASEDCIKLLNGILTDPQARNLLLLTTHRELGPSSPARSLKNELLSTSSSPSSPSILTQMQLGDLSPMVLCDILESVLGGRSSDEEEIQGLALVVHSKTGGTIFVVVQFLRMLYQQGLLSYNFHELRWDFCLDQIASETCIYGNVLQLVCEKLSTLPLLIQIPLTTAAFLGFSTFDVALLYNVLQGAPIVPSATTEDRPLPPTQISYNSTIGFQEPDELRAILRVAVKEGLLERLHPRAAAATHSREGSYGGEWYRFSHDRVREGALSLLSQQPHELQNMHLQMGLELRRIRDENVLGAEEEELEQFLIHAVRHLNEGMCMANAVVERVELARMNLEAAIVVIERSAFPTALEFLQTGLGLLDDETKWKDQYHLTLELSDRLIQVQFCTGQHEQNWRSLDDVLEHGQSTNDKLNAYRLLILSLVTEGRFEEAIAANLAVLDKLGVSMPRNFIKVHRDQALNRIRRLTKGRTEDDLLVYRDHVDELTRNQCEFLGTLSDTCNLSGHHDYRILSMFRATDCIIDNGIEELAPMAMLGCAYQCGLAGEVDKSYKFGKLAVKIAMEGKNPRNDGKALAMAYESAIALKEPYHKCLDSLLSAFKFILDNGEIEHLYFPIKAYSTMYFHCGLRLEPLKSDVLQFIDMLESFGQTSHLNLFRPFAALVINLMGSKSENGDEYSGRRSIGIPSSDSPQVMQYYYRYEMMLAFFLDDITVASEMSSKLDSPKMEGPSSWLPPRFFYQGLIEYALCRKTGKSKHRRQGKVYLQKLEKFVKQGNLNCQHLLLVLHAEHLSLGGGAIDNAQQAYDLAIASCGKLGFLHGQGLANELAGIHFLERGDRSWASTYLGRSHALFRQWGALSKTHQMESKYGELLRQTPGRKEDKTRNGSFLRGVSKAQHIVDSTSNLQTKSSARHSHTPSELFAAQSNALPTLSFH